MLPVLFLLRLAPFVRLVDDEGAIVFLGDEEAGCMSLFTRVREVEEAILTCGSGCVVESQDIACLDAEVGILDDGITDYA